MKKSLEGRFIRAWRVALRPYCDSKVSPFWRKRDLKGYCRDAARTSVDSIIDNRMRDIARVAVGDDWRVVSCYVEEHRAELEVIARDEIDNDEYFDALDEVNEELSCWE